jgi:hypothetical protein
MSQAEGNFMIHILLTTVVGVVGYLIARNFVRNRLRFVDAIQAPWAPPAAGALAFVLTWPLALLPLLSAAPGVVFGIGVGLGTFSGARMIRRDEGRPRRLVP